MAAVPDALRAIPESVLSLITAEVARTYRTVPIRLEGGRLVVAVADGQDTRTLRALQFATGHEVVPFVVAKPVLEAAVAHYYPVRPGAGAPKPASSSPPPPPPPPPVPAPISGDLDLADLLGEPTPAASPAPSRPAPAATSGDFDLDDLMSLETPPAAAPARTPPPAPPPPAQRAAMFQVEPVEPGQLEHPAAAAIAMLSTDTARNFHVLPVAADEKTISVVFFGEPDPKTLRAIQYATQRLVKPLVAGKAELEAAILRHYPARVPQARSPLARRAPSIDPKMLESIEDDVARLLTAMAARKYRAVAVEKMGRRLTVAMEDPDDLEAVRDLEFVAEHTIKALRCDKAALDLAIEKYYPPEAMKQAESMLEGAEADLLDSVMVVDEDAEEEERAKEVQTHDLEAVVGDDAPAVKLCNMLVKEAVARGASDIHIETYETRIRIRYRVDGILYEVAAPNREMRNSLISRIKVISGMNIAETRMPQDGRVKMKMRAGERIKGIDLRVSAIPTIWGEKIVMRVLDPDRLQLDLTRLGFEQSSLDRFQRAIVKPYGMCLVVGPSGCGKTNTLYSAMSAINTGEVNIMTAEDPVEFNIKGINQVQTDDAVGLTFATSLRSFLRQDPNIILVGEIRDFETAEIAVKASLTGHLVLTTLHTTDAPTTVSRLINMGVEPFLVSNSVLLISAQRLVRKVCEECKEPDPRSEAELLELGFTPDDLPFTPMKGRGCLRCHMTGNKGRTGVFEVLEFDDDIRELVMAGATPLEIRARAKEKGMLTLRMSGLAKIKAGLVPIAEVERETIR